MAEIVLVGVNLSQQEVLGFIYHFALLALLGTLGRIRQKNIVSLPEILSGNTTNFRGLHFHPQTPNPKTVVLPSLKDHLHSTLAVRIEIEKLAEPGHSLTAVPSNLGDLSSKASKEIRARLRSHEIMFAHIQFCLRKKPDAKMSRDQM